MHYYVLCKLSKQMDPASSRTNTKNNKNNYHRLTTTETMKACHFDPSFN